MKNIFYLIKSTKSNIYEKPRVFSGTTNYLYRQMLIHNHKWNPREKERKRLTVKDTLKKGGWKPLVVVSGLPSETVASQFKAAMDTVEYNKMGNPNMFRFHRTSNISQVDYRIEQVYWMLKDMTNKMEEKGTPILTLNVYWETLEKINELEKKHGPLPFGINSIEGINISEIDTKHFDLNDLDDDRNYEKLLNERLISQKNEKLLGLSKELNIPFEQVENILDESRRKMAEMLTSRKGKSGLKAKAKITIK